MRSPTDVPPGSRVRRAPMAARQQPGLGRLAAGVGPFESDEQPSRARSGSAGSGSALTSSVAALRTAPARNDSEASTPAPRMIIPASHKVIREPWR